MDGWQCGALVLTAAALASSPIKAEAQAVADPAVRIERDLRYASGVESDIGDRLLDVYSPTGAMAAPVVVSLHGGSGSKDSAAYVELSNRLAANGMVVFNATFRGTSPRAYAANDGVMLREAWESAECAVRFARGQARAYGGDPNRITVVGHSAGGFFGLLASLVGEDSSGAWESLVSSRGAPERQMTCEAADEGASVEGFVGFNGAYFVLAFVGVPSEDPELWRLVNPASHVQRNPTLTTRFIVGANDGTQPDRHIDMVRELSAARDELGADSDVVVVDAEHGYSFSGEAWRLTLAAIRVVAEGS